MYLHATLLALDATQPGLLMESTRRHGDVTKVRVTGDFQPSYLQAIISTVSYIPSVMKNYDDDERMDLASRGSGLQK